MVVCATIFYPLCPSDTNNLGSALRTSNMMPNSESKLQQVIKETSQLATVLSGPEVHGDERDGVVSKLNQLLAAVGTGKGYYTYLPSMVQSSGQMQGMPLQPYDFTADANVFNRLRGVVYNRLSQYKNADGIVSFILNMTADEWAAGRQAVLDKISGILRFRQQQAWQAAAQRPLIHVKLISVIQQRRDQVELVICARESGKGLWTATQLYGELMQNGQAIKSSLPSCTGIVPRVEIGRNELEDYLSQPPVGFEEKWANAMMANPDPQTLVPFPVQGFEQLRKRQQVQLSSVSLQLTMIKQLIQRMTDVEKNVFAIRSQYASRQEIQRTLSHRLLRVLVKLILDRKCCALDAREEELQCRLETVSVHLNASDKLRARLDAVLQSISHIDLSGLSNH